MSDVRRDPVSGRWVIIAEDRAERPIEFERGPVRRVSTHCPFCVGHEGDTPQAIANYRLIEGTTNQTWQVRVVPNKYPAINGQGRAITQSDGLFRSLPPVGAHEVIIESPQHCLSVTDLSTEQAELVYMVYRDRLRALSENGDLAYGLIFKNAGASAGASLEHLHSQLIATPMMPTDAQMELANALDFHRREGACVICAVLDHELTLQTRVVGQTPNFVTWCPFASRFPYEMWIAPRKHASRFEMCDPSVLSELAQLVRQTVGRLEIILERPAYNWLLRTAPFDSLAQDHYHWHVEIFPRLTEVAGFELGTGCYINCQAPERAAEILRDASP